MNPARTALVVIAAVTLCVAVYAYTQIDSWNECRLYKSWGHCVGEVFGIGRST